MYVCMHVHIYIYTKYFSMPLENFILIRRRRETIIARNGDSVMRTLRANAVCNK